MRPLKKIKPDDDIFELVDVFGKACLFTDYRIDRRAIPEGYYAYDTRHSYDDWSRPSSIEDGVVLVNFCGTIITDTPFTFEASETKPNGFLSVPYKEYGYIDSWLSWAEGTQRMKEANNA